MWKFFGENKIFSLMTTQLVMSVFGIMISLPVDKVGLGNILYVPTLFALLLYLFLLYAPVWQLGSQDAIKIDRGEKVSIFKGIYIGLFANALNFIFAGLMAIFYLLKDNSLCELLFTIFKLIENLGQGIYFGTVLQFFSTNDQMMTVFYLVIPFLSTAFISFFYALGRRNAFIPTYSLKQKK